MARMTVWQPFSEMLALNAAMDQMADNRLRSRSMPVDLTENAEGYKLYTVLPGVRPEDLAIDFADDVLTIKAESKLTEAQEGVRYHLRELAAGTYERSFRFPVAINADAIEAHFEHGLLTLYLPRAESVKPRRIAVQAAV